MRIIIASLSTCILYVFLFPQEIANSQILDDATNVGMGAATTNTQLNVSGDVQIGTGQSGAVLTVDPSTGSAMIDSGQNDVHDGIINIFGDAGTSGGVLRIYNAANEDVTTDAWVIRADGNLEIVADSTSLITMSESGGVGIGVSPNDSLDVVGDVDATGCFQVNDTTTVGGTCVSDIRLKKNVRPIGESLEKLAHLKPVSFEYTDPSYGPGVQEGLVAQEVEKVFPEWIVTKKDGYKRIVYGLQLQMHLIQAVKELNADNEALKRRIEVLEGS